MKIFLPFLFLFIPFLVSADIWTDGTVDLKSPKIQSDNVGDCANIANSSPVNSVKESECQTIHEDAIRAIDSNRYDISVSFTVTYQDTTSLAWSADVYYKNHLNDGYPEEGKVYHQLYTNLFFQNIRTEDVKSCPPDSFPSYTSVYQPDEETYLCYDPNQVNINDSCNVSSGFSSLNVQVTDASGCYTLPDGSMCKYQAVDVGGGNQVYQMDLEGDCYSEELPSLDGNPDNGGLPVGDECVNNGGLLVCPEDPDNVCNSSGSSFGGGSINNCQSGCGYVNNQFVCYDIDTDSDGLPDYNDPDIDGDGIKNEDDIDSDGDGNDDPVTSSTTKETTVNVDLTPVVNELKKANTSLDNIEDSFKTDHGQTPDDIDKDNRLTELNNDYKTQLEDFIAQGSSELGYTDTINFTNNIASVVPTDGCKPYHFEVGSSRTFDLDLCAVSQKTEPILYWLFAFLTSFYVFIRVNEVIRSAT